MAEPVSVIGKIVTAVVRLKDEDLGCSERGYISDMQREKKTLFNAHSHGLLKFHCNF